MENDEEHFSLKWSNFRSSLTEGFHDFLQEERMVDVTLAAEGKFLQAHKLVLSICSPYFKSLFDVNPCKHPIVILKDVGHHELSYMLEFMYRGEVGVKHEELPSFLKLAESLKIKGLAGERIENNDNSILSKTRPSITRVRKKKGAGSYASDYAADNNESDSSNIKQERFNRQRKRKLAVKSENSKAAQSKKVKQEKSDQEKKSFDDGSIGNIENDDDDDNPLAKLMVTKKEKQDENCKLSESSSLNLNNGLDDDDDNDDDEDETTADDFDMTPNIFNPDNSTESDQIPQGGKFGMTPIWNYFRRIPSGIPSEKDVAVCNFCNSALKYHNTSPMTRHLRTFHPDAFHTYKFEFLHQRKILGHSVRSSILSSWAKRD